MLAQLIPTSGARPITLEKPITVVGRSSNLCDLVIQHTSVSKMHCLLVKTDGLIYMRDLGSTNGTRVNGQRVIRGALLPGDQLSFSGVAYKIHLGPDLPVGPASPNGATEMLRSIPDEDDGGGFAAPAKKSVKKSAAKPPLRKARSLGDSDLLPAD